MSKEDAGQAAEETIDLKEPGLAAFLAWLVPGLGHWYQGRRFKAALYSTCILGTFFYGLYLGGSSEVGWGRVVYFSFRPNDLRLAFLCQIGTGVPAAPALFQAGLFYNGKAPLGHGFMAPPRVDANDPGPGRETLHDLYRRLPRLFEIGTAYTMIAGLLNILAVYDACCGPVAGEPARPANPPGNPAQPAKKEEDPDPRKARPEQAEDQP